MKYDSECALADKLLTLTDKEQRMLRRVLYAHKVGKQLRYCRYFFNVRYSGSCDVDEYVVHSGTDGDLIFEYSGDTSKKTICTGLINCLSEMMTTQSDATCWEMI